MKRTGNREQGTGAFLGRIVRGFLAVAFCAVGLATFAVESDEGTLDLRSERIIAIDTTEAFTYSATGWGEPGAGESAAITYTVNGGSPQTLAADLAGDGTVDWTSSGKGKYVFTHTSGTATESAVFVVIEGTVITLPTGVATHTYVVSNLTAGAEGEILPFGSTAGVATYDLPIGAHVAIYCVPAEGYAVRGTNPYDIPSVTDGLTIDPADLPKGSEVHDLTVTKDGSEAEEDVDYRWNGKLLVVLNDGLTVSGTTAVERVQVDASDVTFDSVSIRIGEGVSSGYNIVYVKSPDCTLTLVGENELGGVGNYAISTYNNLTVDGTGSLNIGNGVNGGIWTDGNLTISGSVDVTVTIAVYNSIWSEGGITVEGAVNLTATNSSPYTCVGAEYDIGISTSGRVELWNTGEYPAIGSSNGDVSLAGTGEIVGFSVECFVETYAGSVYIGTSDADTVSVVASNLSYSCMWAVSDLYIRTGGRVACTSVSSVLGCEGTMVFGPNATNVVLRGGEPGETGALELYDADALVLPEGWGLIGSTDVNADDLTQVVAYKLFRTGEWGAYTSMLGNRFVTAVTFGPVPPVTYLEWNESTKAMEEKTTTGYEVVTDDLDVLEAGKTYVVQGVVTNVTGGIVVEGTAANPTYLILSDGAKLVVKGGYHRAGIAVGAGGSTANALVVCAQSDGTGALEATGGEGAAGIGGGANGSGGKVVFNGGEVLAMGGSGATGIGGGTDGNGAVVVVNGGKVDAVGGGEGTGCGKAVGRGVGGADDGSITVAPPVQLFKGMTLGELESTTVEGYLSDPAPALEFVSATDVAFDAMGGVHANGFEIAHRYCLLTYTLPEVTRDGYEFAGWFDSWKSDANKVEDGQDLIAYGAHSLYAKWTSKALPKEADEPEGEKTLNHETLADGSGEMLKGANKALAETDLAVPEFTSNGADGVPYVIIEHGAFSRENYDKQRERELIMDGAADEDAVTNDLTSVTISSYVTNIQSYAFSGCQQLTNVTFSKTRDYVTGDKAKLHIDDWAFKNTSVREVVFPADSCVVLDYGAFAYAEYLEKIVFLGDIELTAKYPFVGAGTRTGRPVTIQLSAKNAADPAFVASLTNGMSSARVVVDQNTIWGEIVPQTFGVSGQTVTLTFKVPADSPWQTVTPETLYGFFATTPDKACVGTGTVVSPATLTGPDADGVYTATFTLPAEAVSGFFKFCIGEPQDPAAPAQEIHVQPIGPSPMNW